MSRFVTFGEIMMRLNPEVESLASGNGTGHVQR